MLSKLLESVVPYLLVVVVVGPVLRRHVKHKVSYLTIEVALVDVPFIAIPTRNVKVRVEEGNAREVLAALDDGLAVGVAHKLRIIVLNNRG